MRIRTLILGLCAGMVAMALSPIATADKPAAMSPQSITLPNGATSLKGLGESFSPNIATGTLSYSIPIQSPPGFIAPEVALSYSSGGGKSEVGVGFRMPRFSIYRSTDKGLPDFDPNDRFSVEGPVLNDELVLVNSEQRYYRLKNEGPFALFIQHIEDNYWEIRLQNGNTVFLGESINERSSNSHGTYRWLASRTIDDFGHSTRYLYTHDEGHTYLSEIRSQLHAAPQFQNSIQFEYETRPDAFTDYTYGYADTTRWRLKAIRVHHGQRQLREYKLSYDSQALFSLLTSVKLYGEGSSDNANRLSMPTLSFEFAPHSAESHSIVTMTNTPPLEGLLSGEATLDDVNGDALPDILYGATVSNPNFRYYENWDGTTWGSARTISNTPNLSLSDEGVLLTDANGDGFRDLVHPHANGFRYYPGGGIDNGIFMGFGEAQTIYAGSTVEIPWTSTEIKISDLNRDGRTDLLYDTGGQVQQILNLKTNALQASFLSNLPVDIDFEDPSIRMEDFNGDGHLDFIRASFSPSGSSVRTWFGRGNGIFAAEQSMTGVPTGFQDEFFLQDINKDGQTDILRISGTAITYYLNNGNLHFTAAPGQFQGLPISETQMQLFADMNGNGTTDIVWITNNYKIKYLDLMLEPFHGLLQRIDNGMGMVTSFTYRMSTEFLIDHKNSGTPWKTPLRTPMPLLSETHTTDSLDTLGPEFIPTQSRTLYSYRDGYYDGKEREFRGFAQATSTEEGDGFHDGKVTTIWFHVGRNLETGEDEEALKGKKFMATITDLDGNLFQSSEVYWEQEWLCQSDLNTSTQILPQCDSSADNSNNKDNLVTIALQEGSLTGLWEKTSSPRWTYSATEFNEWAQPTKVINYGEVAFPLSRTIGMPLNEADINTTIGNDEIINEKNFINDVEKWRIGVECNSKVTDVGGSIVSQSRKYYDGPEFQGLALCELTNGKLTRESVWLSYGMTEAWIDSVRNRYDANGNVVESLDGNGNSRTFVFDPYIQFLPIEETIHLTNDIEGNGALTTYSLTYQSEYDFATGAVLNAVDYNSNTLQRTYDGLGRLTKVIGPLDTPEQPSKEFTYQYGTTENPVSTTIVSTLVDRATNTYQTQWSYSDAFGRNRQTKSLAEAPYGYISTGWSRMSKRGALTHSYESYASSSSEFEAPGEFVPHTTTYYDTMSRESRIYPPAAEHGATYSQTSYLPLETWVYDRRDTKEDSWEYPAVTHKDGQGRITRMDRYNDYGALYNGERLLSWAITYDVAGNITSITDPHGNNRTYGYDSLGRMMELNNPNAGSLTYEYDNVGNLLARTDALGQRIRAEYDAGNRNTTVWYENHANGLEDTIYNYYYDFPKPIMPQDVILPAASNLKGNLAWVDGPISSFHHYFDSYGRKTTEIKQIWDPNISSDKTVRTAYQQSYTHDDLGRVKTFIAPGNFGLAYSYNERSLLTSIDGINPNEFSIPNLTYDVDATVKGITYGNQITTCIWRNAHKQTVALGSGKNETCTSPDAISNNAFQNLRFSYFADGNLSQTEDLSPPSFYKPAQDWSFEYDRLYQLTKASHVSLGEINFTYDKIQNLLSRETTNPYSPLTTGQWQYPDDGEAGPNRVIVAGGQPLDYDVLGNTKHYNGFALSFNTQGQLVRATGQDGESVEYFYDYLGELVLKQVIAPGATQKNYTEVFGNYKVYDGIPSWIVSVDKTALAEIQEVDGVELSLSMLDAMVAKSLAPNENPKVLSEEYSGEDISDAADHYWEESTFGSPKRVVRYYHNDFLGTPTMLSDSAGDVVVERQDSPYGNELYKHGKGELLGLAGSANSSETEVESQLGLIRMGTRFYAPGLGRWISPDALFLESPQKVITNPLQSNLFSYSLNNPVNFNDPSGQEITAENIFAAFSLATQDLSEETGVKIEFVAGTGVEAQAQFYDVGIGTKRSAEVSWDPAERSIKVSGEVTKNVGGGDTGVGGSIAWGHGKVDAELQGILGAAGDVSGTISVDKQTFTGSVKHEKAIVDVATRVGLFKLGASSKVVTEGGPDGGEIAVENSVTLFSVKLTHKKVVVSTKKKKPRRRTMTRVNRSYRGDGSFTGLIADSWFEMLH